jgi:hypothetical protein
MTVGDVELDAQGSVFGGFNDDVLGLAAVDAQGLGCGAKCADDGLDVELAEVASGRVDRNAGAEWCPTRDPRTWRPPVAALTRWRYSSVDFWPSLSAASSTRQVSSRSLSVALMYPAATTVSVTEDAGPSYELDDAVGRRHQADPLEPESAARSFWPSGTPHPVQASHPGPALYWPRSRPSVSLSPTVMSRRAPPGPKVE